MTLHQVYLIPGFFGFSSIGGLSYFRQVRETLEDVFVRRGVQVELIEVRTLPTASLRARAQRLLLTALEHRAYRPGVAVHFVGHSTGALDARLAASPGARIDPALDDDPRVEAILANLRTIVSVSGAHRGTPLANFFSTIYGKNLLYLITLVVIVGLWRRPIEILGALIRGLGRLNDLLGLDETLLHQLTNQLLRDFNPTVEAEVRAFLRSILEDQGVILQLTPEGMDLFNATTLDRPSVRYVSWATAAPPPAEVIRRITVRHALTPLNKILYGLLWTLTSRAHAGYPYHAPIRAVDAITGQALSWPLTEKTSDGVVPTLSQIWGELRGVVQADHLDVVGHYLRGPFDVRDGADWFGSGASFDRAAFEWLWEDVASALLSSPAPGSGG